MLGDLARGRKRRHLERVRELLELDALDVPMTCLALNSLRALAAGRDELGAGLLEIFLFDEFGARGGDGGTPRTLACSVDANLLKKEQNFADGLKRD